MEVLEAGDPVALGTPQQRALLALLLINANQVVSRDRLIDELWGASPPQSAAKLVQVYVSRLRRALLRGDEVVVTKAPGYLAKVGTEELDVQRFERWVSEGRSLLAEGLNAEAAERLRQGLDLWRGPPLADFTFDAFAAAEIARLTELRLGAVEDRIDADLALGRTDLVGEIQGLIARHPLRERIRGQLMLALYRAGRQSDALAAFRDARLTLVEEVGVEPGPALRDLERAILAQAPELDPPPAATAAPGNGESEEAQPVPAERDELIGRLAELDLVDRALGEAEAGRGGLVLVGGPAGIGKSRLLDEVALIARAREMTVLWGRCWEAGGAPAYWPWIQSLRAYLSQGDRGELLAARPELETMLPELRDFDRSDQTMGSGDAEAARFRLFEAVVSLLAEAADDRPLVLIFDDLHAADEPSLLLLRFAASQLGDSPLLIIGAHRDLELERESALTAVLPELARERRTRQLELGGLSESEVARLIEVAGTGSAPQQSVDAIYRGTEGNPLFVGEVVRLLLAEGRLDRVGSVEGEALPLPPGVREVIGGRLRRLSGDCVSVLALGAVLGREFEFTSLVQACDRSEEAVLDALEEALGAKVIAEIPGAPHRLRFAHALIRDSLYGELTAPRRARLHLTVGEALEQRYAEDPGPHLAELAHHYLAAGPAGDAERATQYARAAADRAIALLAYEEAVRQYAMALDSLDFHPARSDALRCELLLALADAQTRAGEGDVARETFLNAAALARTAGEPTLLARAALGYGGRFLWTRAAADDRLVPLLEEGLAQLGEADPILRVQLLSRLGASLRGEPTRGRREQVCEEAISIARELRDPATLAYALDAAEASLGGPDTVGRRLAEADELLSLAQQIGDRERLFDAYDHHFWAVWELGDPERRRIDMVGMTTVSSELRQPAQLWSVTSTQAVLAISHGEWAEAEELMARAASIGERAIRWSAVASQRVQDFMIRSELDRLDGLATDVAASADEFPSPLLHAAVLTFIHARLGQRAEAEAILTEVVAHDLADWHVDEEWLASLCLLAEACATLEQTAPASVLYGHLVPYVMLTAIAIPEIAIGPVARPLGLLATILGRYDEAEAHFEEAMRVSARLGARPALAHAQRDYARLLLARGGDKNLERARVLVDLARTGYRTLGMDAFEARAADLMLRV